MFPVWGMKSAVSQRALIPSSGKLCLEAPVWTLGIPLLLGSLLSLGLLRTQKREMGIFFLLKSNIPWTYAEISNSDIKPYGFYLTSVILCLCPKVTCLFYLTICIFQNNRKH